MRDFYKRKKDVVAYVENYNYYPYLEGLIQQLDGNVSYITSESEDPRLWMLDTFYLGRLFPAFMAVANCKVFIMTLTDLNSFHIRRSFQPVHYVYVFHSPISTHMIYRQEAFDHYDSILCVGPHQVEEIRKREKLYGLKPKKLIEVGYSRIERVHMACKSLNKESGKVKVLIAPTWGTPNLYDICGTELIETLLRKDYEVVLGFHPEIVKRGRHFSYEGVTTKTSLLDARTIAEADVLITNWSGISLEYAFGTERPVIFIDTPPKVRNPKYCELRLEPLEVSLRNEVGTIVSPNNVKNIDTVIQELLSEREAWKSKLSKLRSRYVFNFGKSSEVGADYIKGLLEERL